MNIYPMFGQVYLEIEESKQMQSGDLITVDDQKYFVLSSSTFLKPTNEVVIQMQVVPIHNEYIIK